MIVASLLLILVAVTLLVLGLAGSSSTVLISSIAASLLAAVALVVGARQAAALRAGVEAAGDRAGRRGATIPTQTVIDDDPVPGSTGRRQPASVARTGAAGDDPGPVPDEPAARPLPPADAALVAQLGTDVLVMMDARAITYRAAPTWPGRRPSRCRSARRWSSASVRAVGVSRTAPCSPTPVGTERHRRG